MVSMGNQQQCRIITSTAALFLAIGGILLIVIPTEDIKEHAKFMYGIVLDAGSSHTAMYIYKWPADKQNGTGIVSHHSECDVKACSSYESLCASCIMCTAESPAQTKDFPVSLHPHLCSWSLLKRCLWRYTHLTDESCQKASCLDKERLLLVSLVLLAMCGMVLLFIWNYQCYIVTKVCQDLEQSSENVMFDMDEQRLSSYGPA